MRIKLQIPLDHLRLQWMDKECRGSRDNEERDYNYNQEHWPDAQSSPDVEILDADSSLCASFGQKQIREQETAQDEKDVETLRGEER